MSLEEVKLSFYSNVTFVFSKLEGFPINSTASFEPGRSVEKLHLVCIDKKFRRLNLKFSPSATVSYVTFRTKVDVLIVLCVCTAVQMCMCALSMQFFTLEW